MCRARCPKCYIPVFSNYGNARDLVRFVRIGTMDKCPDWVKPDIHIYTCSKLPWVNIPEDTLTKEQFYDVSTVWSEEAQRRWEPIVGKIKGRSSGNEDEAEETDGVEEKLEELKLDSKEEASGEKELVD